MFDPNLIRDGLKVAKLLGSKHAIVPGPLSTGRVDEYDDNLKKGLSVLIECFQMFSSQLENHWKTGDGPGGYLCTNNGIRALFHIIEDVAEHIRYKNGTDLCLFDADETFAEIKPYLQTLIDFFKTAQPHEIKAFRRIGSSLTAVRQQSWGMEAHIQTAFPEFKPTGLQEYLDSRDVAGTEKAAAKVMKIQRKLFDYVVGTLKKHYGTHNKAWWTQGIPLRIRQDCIVRWETRNREGDEETLLHLINYVEICIKNWYLVKDVISLGARDKENKKVNTKWIKKLNDIRNITAHPERGVLSTDQVALVNKCCEKVQKYMPEQDRQT